MKLLLLFFMMIAPLQEVEHVTVAFPSKQQDIFINYTNDNFSQQLSFHANTVTARIKSRNFPDLNLNFRTFPDQHYIDSLNGDVRAVVLDLLDKSQSLEKYLVHISFFLDSLRYTREDLPQDAEAVIRYKRGSCVGFANAVKVLMKAVGIRTRMAKGFYLERGEENNPKGVVPVPHRWVEIILPNGVKFFYDPQYQEFSAHYIITRNDVDFTRVKKFKVNVLNKSKKLIN